MGNKTSKNLIDLNLKYNSKIIQESKTTCNVNYNNTKEYNTTIVKGDVNIGGNVDFSQTCNSNATCVMSNTLDSSVADIVSAVAQQTAIQENGLIPFFNNKIINKDTL